MLIECKPNQGSLSEFVLESIPNTGVEIDLRNNEIKELHNDIFENCQYLEKIDLSQNMIPTIPSAMLSTVFNLREITLADNWLRYNDDSFPANVFQHTLNLTSLSIQSDLYDEEMTLDNLGETLKKIPQTLEELNINVPASDGFAVKFTNFTKLKRLGIYDSDSMSKFNTITNDTFKPLENIAIEELRIKASNLHAVQPLAFGHFSELTRLDMSETIGMNVAEVYPAWIGLQRTKIRKLVLSSMWKRILTTELITLNDTFFEEFHLPYLSDLQLESAQINSVAYTKPTFTGLPNLEILNMSNNYISMIDLYFLLSDFLKHLTNLQELDISYQFDLRRSIFGFFSFDLPPNLSKLDMSYMRPKHDHEATSLTFSDSSGLSYFSYTGNYVEVLLQFDVNDPDPDCSWRIFLGTA